MYRLSIVTPEKIFYDKEIKSLVVPGTDGYLGVLTDHAPLITALKPGKIEFYESEDKLVVMAVSGGFLEVSGNKANLLVDAVEFADEIDIDRAKIAYQKAKEKLKAINQENSPDINKEQIAYERAANRIKIYYETH